MPWDDFATQVLRQTRQYLFEKISLTTLLEHGNTPLMRFSYTTLTLSLSSCFRQLDDIVNVFLLRVCLMQSTSSRQNLTQLLIMTHFDYKRSLFVMWTLLNSHSIPSKSPLWRDITSAKSMTTARILNSLRETSLFPVISRGGNWCQKYRTAQAEREGKRAWLHSLIKKSVTNRVVLQIALGLS